MVKGEHSTEPPVDAASSGAAEADGSPVEALASDAERPEDSAIDRPESSAEADQAEESPYGSSSEMVDAENIPDAQEAIAAEEEEVVAAEEKEAVEAEESEVETLSGASDEEEDEQAEQEEDQVEEEEAVPDLMAWYVLKVQSNREKSIREAIVKRIKIEQLEEFVGEVLVPTEKVTEIKDGKKRVMERKFFPGYIMIHLELNDDTWFAIRETPGVGDFVGADGKPVPMTEQDVAKMLGRKEEGDKAEPRLKISFQKGDRVKIKEGTFENFEGDVDEVIESKGLVRVMIQIFGRPTPVELEYWQVDPL